MTAPSADEKRAGVDTALQPWRQGDCVLGDQWFVHRLALEAPLTGEAIDAAREGIDLAEVLVRGFVVVSQTCDLVRSCRDRPYVEVAPLVEVNAENLQMIERARMPRYAFVPGQRDFPLVADLDRLMTVEKAVVAGWERVGGCASDQETRDFAQALARKRSRFAFPEDFTRIASRLQDRLQEKHNKQSEEGKGLRALREIRVRATPSWESGSVDLMFWFVRTADEPEFDGQSWDQLLERWLTLVPAGGRFRSVEGLVMTLDDMTASDYVESDPLDLDHLSS